MDFSIYQNTFIKLQKELLKWITLENYQKAANKLGVLINKKIQLQKHEQVVFIDFNIFEEFDSNKRIIVDFADKYKAKTEVEKLIINGMKYAINSLYIIKDIDVKSHQIMLKDLLNTKDYYYINDEMLSKTCKVKTLIFTRLINVENFYFPTELKLLFKSRYKNKLIRICQKKSLLEADDTHRFINVFHLHRKWGILL